MGEKCDRFASLCTDNKRFMTNTRNLKTWIVLLDAAGSLFFDVRYTVHHLSFLPLSWLINLEQKGSNSAERCANCLWVMLWVCWFVIWRKFAPADIPFGSTLAAFCFYAQAFFTLLHRLQVTTSIESHWSASTTLFCNETVTLSMFSDSKDNQFVLSLHSFSAHLIYVRLPAPTFTNYKNTSFAAADCLRISQSVYFFKWK